MKVKKKGNIQVK